ncbi:uncharacterized protein LOC141647748 [Silene latifolia]|uniref:uncharacterized protein LOC141647748 n=1 Tax=Silene latifolia TaxID=37657 RepID=UPI003D77C030
MSLDRRALPNYFPEDGAIFMANPLTREECFERKLFGLPANFEDFVLRIKIGMLLFLFDFKSRKLYGVFEASSKGGFNLVPDAFKSSNSKFPAQVHFNILWQCSPLQEDAFHDAIIENYFAPYKFNLGLSTEQVNRLLVLFRRTKLQIQRTHMSEGYHQRPNKIVTPLDEIKVAQTECGQGRDICNPTMMKTLPKSTPKKLASVVVCDPKLTPDLDCSIKFPSLEPAESEDQDEEKNHMSRNSRASVFYSENSEARLSVFKRLSGWSTVIEEKSGRMNARTEHLGQNTKFENIREKASVNTSVVSGLGNDVKMGAKNEQSEKLSGTNVMICKDSKRKGTFLADKQQKRKCLLKTKTCDKLSDVSNLSQGSSKTETSVIVTGDAVVVTGPCLTKPFICGGGEEHVDDKLQNPIQLETSCDQDPVEMLLAQYKDYLRRSRMEDQTDINGARTCVT